MSDFLPGGKLDFACVFLDVYSLPSFGFVIEFYLAVLL